MESAISSFPDLGFGGDAGNTIDVTDVTDDLGMNLLANSKYMGAQTNNTQSSYNTINLSPESSSRNQVVNVQPVAPALQEVEFSTMEPVQPISIDTGGSSSLPSVSFMRDESSSSGIQYESYQNSSGPSINMNSSSTFENSGSVQTSLTPPMDPEEEKKKKTELINKLQRLEQKGFPVTRRFTLDNSLDEIKSEYARLVDARQMETSIRFQRNMLMGLVTGLEWMNNKFDPFDLKLDGWSESVHENVEDYDDIFEELYDKYKERGQMPPEARLLFQLAGSGFMCHISNSFFRSKMPSAENIFKANPELAKQFTQAAAQQAGPGFGNFMGMAMGMPPPQDTRPRAGPQAAPQEPMGFDAGSGPTGAFFQAASSRMPNVPQSVASQPQPQVARREMKGPTGVDDILKTFEQVREAEASMSMNSNPPLPPRSPAEAAAQEIASLHSEDMTSIGGASERTVGGRRRKRAAPTGNMISLNV
jgi:hypothetical protein